MTNFKCAACGCCCYFVDVLLNSIKQINGFWGTEIIFPYSHNNGKCEKLTENNRCAVYANRPIVCNVHDICEILAKKTDLNIEIFFEQQKRGCEVMRKIKLKNLFYNK